MGLGEYEFVKSVMSHMENDTSNSVPLVWGLAAKRGTDYLSFICKREKLLLPSFKNVSLTTKSSSATVHKPSLEILKSYQLSDCGTPLASSTDGNCLFSSASIAIAGDNSLTTELRVRTCIEMVNNSEKYLLLPNASDIEMLSPSYSRACLDCATPGGFSSQWTIYALCNAINYSIHVIFPPVNSKQDPAYRFLNTVCVPFSVPTDKISIMWTSCSGLWYSSKLWIANHFVPLIKEPEPFTLDEPFQPKMSSSPVKISSTAEERWPPSSTEEECDKESYHQDDKWSSHSTDDELFQPHMSSSISFSTKDRFPSSTDNENCDIGSYQDEKWSSQSTDDNDNVFTREAGWPSEFMVDESRTHSPEIQLSDDQDSVLTDNQCQLQNAKLQDKGDEKQLPSVTKNANPLPNGKFLASLDLWKIVNDKQQVLPNVPLGPKNNVHFAICNKRNTENKKSSVFWDDCGTWESSKAESAKTVHIVSQDMRQVSKKSDKYCVKQVKQRKITWVPLTPQPHATDIVTLHRYYATLKKDNAYKKKVSWFTSDTNSELASVAIYEYSGIFPTTPDSYIRSNPQTLENIKQDLHSKHDRPNEIYLNQLNKNESFLAPKNTKQIRNLKYREKKQKKQTISNNVADELLQVISMVDTNPFLQEIVHSKNQVPSIICYTNEQLLDLQHAVIGREGKLGIDRTFNLGHFFVTTFVYKNTRVTKRETGDHPIFLGPLFLHRDASYTSYRTFSNHIAAKLEMSFIDTIDIRIPTIMEFGTDDEKALTKAIDHAFPGATRSLCSKHLKDNLKHYMTDVAPMKPFIRNQIKNMIFGQQGIVNADDTFQFELISKKIMDTAENEKFKNYFSKHVKPRIEQYVFQPRRKETTKKEIWTNNNAESMNNVLKVAVNWKPQSTPDLIDKLSDVTKLQFLDLRRSLYDSGNYSLTPKYRSYLIQERIWHAKEKHEKDTIFVQFLRDVKRPRQQRIVSANGKFSVVNQAKKIARKPGQRKSPRAERTKNFNPNLH